MKVATEKAFPRGGKKPGVFAPSKGRLGLFGKKQDRKKLKAKEKRKDAKLKLKSKDEEIKILKHSSAKLVNYKTISEGMLILGCVKEITEFSLKVNLPGRIFGEIPITNISNAYTRVLQRIVSGNQSEPGCQLSDMFQVGQFLVLKVMQVLRAAENDVKVILTASPHEIHSNWAHENVQTGLVLSAAVSGIEDHGYVMDLGIRGTRAFMKIKNAHQYQEIWNNGKKLYVGQVVRCLVTKSVSSDSVTTVELSCNPEEVAEAEADVSKVNMQTLIPGMLFTATITHLIQSGVQVEFGKNEIGYVNEDHLNDPHSLLKDVALGSSYPARLLYIQPLVKSVFLTLLDNVCPANPLPSPFEVFNIGDVEKAKVIRVAGHGVLLKLKKGLRGMVSISHASEGIKYDAEISVVEQLKSIYTPNSHHKCKIMGYDFMTQNYSCTLKGSLLQNELFSPEDYQPGMIVTCEIESVKSSGLNVSLGPRSRSLLAFVPALHMADVPLSNPEKKFKEGTKHKAKVLQLMNYKVWLTLKPSIVNSSLVPLCHYENIDRDCQYEGVVILITPRGLLVEFFNNVKGWVPTHKLSDGIDPTQRFYVGQVIECHVTNVDVDRQRMTLSMASFSHSSSWVNIGRPYCVEVISVDSNRLYVQVCNSSEKGIIPAPHLTDHPVLSKLLLETYKVGQVISSAYCFSVMDELIFSVQNSVVHFFESKVGSQIAEKGLAALKGQVIIPCSVRLVNEKGVLLNAPIPGLSKSIWVPRNYVCSERVDYSSIGLITHQVVMARISCQNVEKSIFRASTSLSHCWDFNYEVGVNLLESYLTDEKRIISHLATKKDPLLKYNPGNMVQGTVKTLTGIGAVVELPDGIKGVVMPHHYKGLSIKAGDKVNGMVLMMDVVNHCVELTLHPIIFGRISKQQGGARADGIKLGKCLKGETMVAKPHQVVVCLKSAGGKQLISVPVRCHINDFQPLTALHELGGVNRIVIALVGGGMIIGVPKKVMNRWVSIQARTGKILTANKDGENDSDEAYSSDEETRNTPETHSKETKKSRLSDEGDGKSSDSDGEEENSDLDDTKSNESEICYDIKTDDDDSKVVSNDVKPKKLKNIQKNISPDRASDSETEDASRTEISPKKKVNKSKQNECSEEKFGDSEANQENISDTEINSKENRKGESVKKKARKSKSKDIDNLLENKLVKEETSNPSIADSDDSKLNTSKGKKKSKHSSEENVSILDISERNQGNVLDVSEGGRSELDKKKSKKSKRKSRSEEHVDSQLEVDDDSVVEASKKVKRLSMEGRNVDPSEQTMNPKSERKPKGGWLVVDSSEIVKTKESSENLGEGDLKSKRKKRNSSSDGELGLLDAKNGEQRKKFRNEPKDTSVADRKKGGKPETLSASIGFVWDAKPELLPAVATRTSDSESSSEEEDNAEKVKKKKKLTPAEKRELARQEEKRLREVEKKLMDSETNPQSADDFDRLVLASPNNSMFWIKYMAFHLQATEIEKARAVADRALKTISFREEQEKLNVWVALLNLENLYGTKESLDKTLEDAVQTNDAFKVYMQMLQIYAESSKIQEADKLTHLLTKKYRDRKDTWLQAGEILMKFKQMEKARTLMQKALNALEKKDHVEVIKKFALLENKFGEVERAHTLMEQVLTSYPKRVDVWCNYVDMLVKSDSLDIARQVLERAVVQKLPARKMKVLFKKYLQFEEQHGTPEGAEKVRQMAVEYVNSATNFDEPE